MISIMHVPSPSPSSVYIPEIHSSTLRMRGYLGLDDSTVWYGDKKHRDRFHQTEIPMFPFYMREWNVSWVGIDEY